LRLAGFIQHRHAAGQEQPQSVLGADRMFFGKQAALLDRGLVARDDQLGFLWIENIGRCQAGGVFTPAIEDGFGAAVGEQVAPVADPLDDQFLVFSSSCDSDLRSVTSSNIAIRNSGRFFSLRAITRLLARMRFSGPRSTANSLRKWPSGESIAS
jgi:hypothetical protein